MKKEDILQYVGSKNGKIIGYFQVPFPVYVVYVAYDSVDSDPFSHCIRLFLDTQRVVLKWIKHLILQT